MTPTLVGGAMRDDLFVWAELMLKNYTKRYVSSAKEQIRGQGGVESFGLMLV